MDRTHIRFQLCHRQFTLINCAVPYRVFDAVTDEKFSRDAFEQNADFDILTKITGVKINHELKIVTDSPLRLYISIHGKKKCIKMPPHVQQPSVDATIKRVRDIAAAIADMRLPAYDAKVMITEHFLGGAQRTRTMPLCHYMPDNEEFSRIIQYDIVYKNIPFTIYVNFIGFRLSSAGVEHEFVKHAKRIDMYCACVHAALTIEYVGKQRRSLFDKNILSIVRSYLWQRT